MKKIAVKNVSADQSGDYFQVHFDNDEESGDSDDFDIDKVLNDTSDYFLIQWGLEYDDEVDPRRYIESRDDAYWGHVTVISGVLKVDSFYLKFRDRKKTKEIEITFPGQNEEDFRETQRILKIMIPNLVIA